MICVKIKMTYILPLVSREGHVSSEKTFPSTKPKQFTKHTFYARFIYYTKLILIKSILISYPGVDYDWAFTKCKIIHDHRFDLGLRFPFATTHILRKWIYLWEKVFGPYTARLWKVKEEKLSCLCRISLNYTLIKF